MILNLKIILGSTRTGRFGDKPAKWIFEEAKKLAGVEAELLDLRDYSLPFFNQSATPKSFKDGQYPNEVAAKLAKKIGEADGFIIVTPEYNHGYPAVLKNALDWIYYEWNNKPVAFISYGSVGGARAIEQLRQVAIELQMAPIREAVHIPVPWNLIDEKGDLKPGALESFKPAARNFLDQLIWWANALKAGREQK